MSLSQNVEEKPKLGVSPDQLQTTDTGFSETTYENAKENSAETTEFSEETMESETRSRTMTEKGLEFHSAVKEKLARTANKNFHANVTAYHTFLVCSKEPNMIDNKMKEFVTLAEKTELELNAWLNLDNNTPKADIITDLLITVRDSLQGARSATFNKLASLDKDETTSVRSKASRKTNRSNTSTSSGGSRSSKQTLITVKARRASLEQKIKFSDAIEEKQKALNKLKLQQRLSETLAEEAVYKKALKDEGHLFEFEPELPHETERMIDRFMTQSELSTRPLSPTAGLLSAVNVDTGIPAAPKSGTGLPAAPYPDTGLPFAPDPGTGIPAAYNPGTEFPAASYPDTGLPFALDPGTGLPS